MADDHTRTFASNGRPGPLRAVAHLGGRAAASALRPVNGAVGAALEIGMNIQRKAVDRVLDSPELERVMLEAVESPRVQTALQVAISSEAANRLVDSFFDSGMFDRLVDRLLESDGLWHLVDEIAQSPAVTAAVSQQGLTFADQVGDQVRDRSRRADDWVERAAWRVIRRRNRSTPDAADPAAATDPDDTGAAAPDLAAADPAVAPGPADAGAIAQTPDVSVVIEAPDVASVPQTPDPTAS
ncbi:MAG: hypothetical protein ACXVR1_02320 [Solirubrobacteraceae bacterium]